LIVDGKKNTNFQEGEILELIDNLDEWLSKGGFLPQQWVNNDQLVNALPFPYEDNFNLSNFLRGNDVSNPR
jgi:hypothetical protein